MLLSHRFAYLELIRICQKIKIAEASRSGVMDERVLVAVQHVTKPFWALQYHPESICTDEKSKKVIYNWFCHALWWNRKVRTRRRSFDGPIQGKFSIRESLLATAEENLGTSNGISTNTTQHPKDPSSEIICHTRTLFIPSHFPVPDILEAIQDMQQDQIVLESSNANEQLEPSSADVRGRYSIIGLNIENCMRFEYTTGNNMVTSLHPTSSGGYARESRMLGGKPGGIWPFLAQYLDERQVSEGNMESPFWGGFMGYTTYELGLETIDVKSRHRNSPSPAGRPDLCFAWVTRSLVVDHRKNVIYLQQLAPRNATSDLGWIDTAAVLLQHASLPKKSLVPLPANNIENGTQSAYAPSVISVVTPQNSAYEKKVGLCQESIRSGDSYELCLTDQTIVTHTPSTPTPSWTLYKTLRTHQPAPFASYLKLGPTTLISSSPERFLTWSSDGKCSLRPMKGTVKKSASINTLEKAKELLDVPKEKAENLMIVDLVRHDLHSVCGPSNVSVPRLMVVEEYKSVFQMISIVEGFIPPPFSPGMEAHLSPQEIGGAKSKRYTGIDVLAASLPPGSMTGAPKKRSCEILQEIEERERGLYSGVVGYMDVGGRGDWSVTIRSMFKWEDEDEDGDGKGDRKGVVEEKWYIGAGGAVTALSTEVGEREEMVTKLSGTLGVFR
jgi:para-aminobenzoate synthetase